MLYSEDMTGHAVIGEPAVNLAVREAAREKEINVDSLLAELYSMLRAEELSRRIDRINAAIGWLSDFRAMGAHSGADQGWMLTDSNDHSFISDATIHLPADEGNK